MCKSNGLFADLHVHSFHSDGSLSPEEIVESAKLNGVGILAITDHNMVDGSIELQRLCYNSGIRCIPAVEICTLDGDRYFHVLAYGFDLTNQCFSDFIRHTRFMLDETSVKLIELMEPDYPGLSLDDYMKYTYDRRLGGWKALHYFMNKGMTTSLKEGIGFYPKYGMTYNKAGYSTVAAVAYRVRRAGGYPVLAHPGEMMDTSDINRFKQELRRIISHGIEGIECYYPTHTQAVTQACLEVCNEQDLLITAGSDCHGVFAYPRRIGEMGITTNKLRLKDLSDRKYEL